VTNVVRKLFRAIGKRCAARQLRRAAAFSAGREPVSHEAFRERIGLPREDQRLVTILRRTVGKACCVEPRLLAPDIPVEQMLPVWRMNPDGWDELDIAFRIEAKSGIRIGAAGSRDRFFVPPGPDAPTFGEWVAVNVPRLRARVLPPRR
jgi:hypothetical protein